MRNRMVIAAVVALVAGGLMAAVPASAGSDGKLREYVVLYDRGASAADARAAIGELGGTVVDELAQIGVARVQTRNADFEAEVAGSDVLKGAAPNQIIGYAEPALREKVDDVESLIAARGVSAAAGRRGVTRGGAAGRAPVGHGDDPRDRIRVSRGGDREPGRPRGRDRHGHRRLPPGHRAELRRGAEPELHGGRSADRRGVHRRIPITRASTRRTSTRQATGHTCRGRSRRPSTASASPGSRPT